MTSLDSSRLDAYDDVLHAVYNATLKPSDWPTVLQRIALVCRSSHALLYTPMNGPGDGGFVFAHNIPQSSIEVWACKSRLEDPFIAAAAARGLIKGGEGRTIDGTDLVPLAHLVKTAFYRDLWAPIGIGRVLSGIVFDSVDAHKMPTVLAVYRGPDDAAFETAEADLLRRIVAHVSRALGVMFHLRDASLQVASSRAALERLGCGVILLSAHGDVLHVNGAAQRSFDTGEHISLDVAETTSDTVPSGLQAGQGRLRLAPRLQSHESALQRLVAGALAPFRSGELTHFSDTLVVEDADNRPCCVFHAAPLSRRPSWSLGVSEACAVIFLYDLTARDAVDPEQLCALFGLTRAESRAALQVMQGGGASTMAERLGVSINTFKTQLKAVYVKTGTGRLPDLLKLLLALSH